MRKKVVLIGAGSAVFTQGLLADFISSADFCDSEIVLVDINEQALAAIEKVAQEMVDFKQSDIKILAYADRKDALPGADVVVSTIAVGGRRAWEDDVFIPRKYGIYQPVGDTTMPGGISRALRMIPAMLAIARDVEELCPKAYFFNYSNPMTAICTALRRETSTNVIGLCHGMLQVEHYLAECLGVDPSSVTSFGAGINHLTFIYDLLENGVSAWGQIERYAKLFKTDNPFSWEVCLKYGAFPAVLDRHVVEFFGHRFGTGEYYGKKLGVDAFSFEGVVKKGDQEHEELLVRASGSNPLDEHLFHRAAGEHEQLVAILSSLFKDSRQIFYVNAPNQGAVPNLPANAILEFPAVATGRGFRQMMMNDFPDGLVPILTKRLNIIDLTVESAVKGDFGLFVDAILEDGAVSDKATASQLAKELIDAHRSNLPQF